jgi:hypothetical protein
LVYPSGHRKYSQKKIDCFIKEQAVIWGDSFFITKRGSNYVG